MSKYYLITLVIYLMYGNCIYCQIFLKNNFRNISFHELISHDKNSYLSTEDFKSTDSIRTIYFDNKYWFSFFRKGNNITNAGIFVYDRVTNRISKVNQINLPALDTWARFLIYGCRLFYLCSLNSDLDNGVVGSYIIYLIDTYNDNIMKEVIFGEKKGIIKKEIINDSLIITMREQKAVDNSFVRNLFPIKTDRPSKWKYIDVGNEIIYVFDKDLNIIRKKEIIIK